MSVTVGIRNPAVTSVIHYKFTTNHIIILNKTPCYVKIR